MRDYTPCCVCLHYDTCTARFKDSYGSFGCGDFEDPKGDDGTMPYDGEEATKPAVEDDGEYKL